MITNAYTIYDRKALHHHTPFFAVADGAAVRSLMDLVNDPNTTIGRHPGDYVLYRVGSFDDSAGFLLPTNPIEHVTDALSLVRDTGSLFANDPPARPNGRSSLNQE